MPTTFYPRNAQIGVATYGNGAVGEAALLGRGPSVSTLVGTTVGSATWVSLGYYATQPLEAFTLAGSISCNLRGAEDNNQANASLGVRFYKWTRAGGLGAQIAQASATVELSVNTETAVTATVTPTSTAFVAGDILVMEVGIINIGTMGANRGVTFYYDGPTAGASGDSYITINETVKLSRRITITE